MFTVACTGPDVHERNIETIRIVHYGGISDEGEHRSGLLGCGPTGLEPVTLAYFYVMARDIVVLKKKKLLFCGIFNKSDNRQLAFFCYFLDGSY